MAIFDVESLLTNIALQETIDLCFQKLFHCKNYIDGLSKDSFREMLTVTMIEFFTFRSRRPEMLLLRGVLKICSKCTREHPNLLHIFRTPLYKNTSGWLLLYFI